MEALRRVTRLRSKSEDVIQFFDEQLAKHRAYVEQHLEDMPEIKDWKWSDNP
jgi:xylulose-5-phosphate/fructose-6-phosphate phosphoketolase